MPRLTKVIAAFGLALGLAACGAPQTAEAPAATEAAATQTSAITFADAWATPTPQGAAVAAGYIRITNAGAEDDKLIAAASPRAGRVELHEMTMDGAMMKMRPVTDGIKAPAGGEVALKPHGLHLMLMDLPAPLVMGETVPVTLTFEKAGPLEATLIVQPRAVADADAEHQESGAGHGK